MPSQSELVNLEDLVPSSHPYRVYLELVDLSLITRQLSDVSSWLGPKV